MATRSGRGEGPRTRRSSLALVLRGRSETRTVKFGRLLIGPHHRGDRTTRAEVRFPARGIAQQTFTRRTIAILKSTGPTSRLGGWFHLVWDEVWRDGWGRWRKCGAPIEGATDGHVAGGGGVSDDDAAAVGFVRVGDASADIPYHLCTAARRCLRRPHTWK